MRRIERVAAQVHRTLKRPAEHPPVILSSDHDLSPDAPDAEAIEGPWDEMFKHNRRQQERLNRTLEERLARGEDVEEALANALDDLALELPDEESGPQDEPWHHNQEMPFDSPPEDGIAGRTQQIGPFEIVDHEWHPLFKRATDLLSQLYTLFRDADRIFVLL